jgi:hypothetical protein
LGEHSSALFETNALSCLVEVSALLEGSAIGRCAHAVINNKHRVNNAQPSSVRMKSIE